MLGACLCTPKGEEPETGVLQPARVSLSIVCCMPRYASASSNDPPVLSGTCCGDGPLPTASLLSASNESHPFVVNMPW